MSFSNEIKKELSELNNLAKKQEVKYELYGYLLTNNISENRNRIKFSTESEYNINRFAKLLKNMNINDYSIEIQGKVFDITLKKKEIEELDFEKIDIEKINDIDLIRAMMRGMFLGSGSINNPENNYHLEMELKEKEKIENIINENVKFGIYLKQLENSIYLKDGEMISNYLAFIGATSSMLKFEEIRVQRHMNNKVNRLVNCKTANLDKIMNASAEQIAAIQKLKSSGKYLKLDKSLKEIAELRLKHPDMPLSELGNLLSKKIGKSGVNYRLKKLIDLSKE